MPMQTTKSGFSMVGAVKAHAADAVDYGQDFTKLPPGIGGGIARLNSLGYGTYKTGEHQGKMYLRAAGVIVSPESQTYVPQVFDPTADGGKGGVKSEAPKTERVAGRQTSVMFKLFSYISSDGKGGKKQVTEDQAKAEAVNLLKQLGGPEYLLDVQTEDDVQAKMNALVADKVAFTFSTRAGKPTKAYPTPMVFEQWHKAVENYVDNGHPADMTEDNSNANADGALEDVPPSPLESPVEEVPTEAEGEAAAGDDLEALAAAADGVAGPEATAAAARLTELAAEAGIEKDAENNLPGDNWTELAGLISAAQAGGGEEVTAEEEAAPEPWKPEAGGQCLYQVLDAKGKELLTKDKKRRKPALCSIKSVSTKNGTATLVDLTTKSSYVGVKLALLKEPPA